MKKSECFHLGYISKIVGYKGEVLFMLDVDDASNYRKLESVFIEISNDLVPFFIQSIQIRKESAAVKLEGIDNDEQAQVLVKNQLYLPLSFLPPLKGKEFYLHEVVGYTVIDKNFGEVGSIENVLDFPQQKILSVKHGTKEVLIPVRDEFILLLDRNKKIMEIEAPEGLIELYLADDQKEDDSE